MTEERFINDMLSCLRAERDRRPDMQAEDIVKFIFQGMLELGLEDGFVQELSSSDEKYIPSFDLTGVSEDKNRTK